MQMYFILANGNTTPLKIPAPTLDWKGIPFKAGEVFTFKMIVYKND